MSFFLEYGFIAVLVGALLEGEVVIITATIFAARGTFGLDLPTVVTASVLGTLLGDHLVYWVGRRFRDPKTFRFRGKLVFEETRLRHVQRFFGEYGPKTVFVLRFAHGLRTAGYFFAGAMRMPWRSFAVADLLGTVVWVALITSIGYLVGRPFLQFLEGPYGMAVTLGIAFLILAPFIIFFKRLEK